MKFTIKAFIFVAIIAAILSVGPGKIFLISMIDTYTYDMKGSDKPSYSPYAENGVGTTKLEDIGYLLKICGAVGLILGFPLIITLVVVGSVKTSDRLGDAIVKDNKK